MMTAAQRVFIDKGYERASMETIAQEAGVSKMTLYRNFASKEELFIACMNEQCRDMLTPDRYHADADREAVRSNLIEYGRTIVDLVSAEGVSMLYRLLIGETKHFDGLGQMFYETGPFRTIGIVEEILGDMVPPAERRMRAQAFVWASLGDPFQRVTLGICNFEDVKDELHAQVALAADMVLGSKRPAEI